MMSDWIIRIKRKLGLIDYNEYWEYKKSLLVKKGLEVGDNVSILDSNIDSRFVKMIRIGSNVTITGSTILAHDASTKKFIGYTKCGGVIIGNDVFIGFGSIVLPNTSIGNNVIIGAGSVVRGKIPDDSLVMGNPAQIVGRTSDYITKYNNMLSDETIYDIKNEADFRRLKSNQFGFVE